MIRTPISNLLVLASFLFLPIPSVAGGLEEGTSIPLEAQPQELVEHAVWDAGNPLVPQFLPVPLLRREGIKGLAIDEESRVALEEYIAFQKGAEANRKAPLCHRTSEESFVDQEDPAGRSLEELLRVQDLVALGTVRSVVPGWGVNQPLTMVYVETREILHCREGFGDGYAVRDVMAGELVSTTLDAGSFELEGVTLCSWTPEAFIMPEVGDQVVIAGSPRPSDPYFLGNWGIVLPVENDRVRPQPYSNLQWNTVPLKKLKQALNGPHSACTGGDR